MQLHLKDLQFQQKNRFSKKKRLSNVDLYEKNRDFRRKFNEELFKIQDFHQKVFSFVWGTCSYVGEIYKSNKKYHLFRTFKLSFPI